MTVQDEPDEEVLVLRVLSAAQRRRVRRLVVAALIVVLTAGGTAIVLTHRSAAQPTALPTPVADPVPSTGADRAAIYAVARARYASMLDGGVHRTVLQFGRLALRGDRARLQVNLVCMPLCGHGEELTLARVAGVWRVVAARTTWVS